MLQMYIREGHADRPTDRPTIAMATHAGVMLKIYRVPTDTLLCPICSKAQDHDHTWKRKRENREMKDRVKLYMQLANLFTFWAGPISVCLGLEISL